MIPDYIGPLLAADYWAEIIEAAAKGDYSKLQERYEKLANEDLQI